MTIRMRTVRRKIDRSHAQPLSAGKMKLSPAWIWMITHVTASNSGSRKLRLTDRLLVLSDYVAALLRRGVRGCRALARGHGVVPPGVEGVATSDAAHGQPSAAKRAVRPQCTQGVRAAGRLVAADGPEERADESAVKNDRQHQCPYDGRG